MGCVKSKKIKNKEDNKYKLLNINKENDDSREKYCCICL